MSGLFEPTVRDKQINEINALRAKAFIYLSAHNALMNQLLNINKGLQSHPNDNDKRQLLR
jgi:hypothetical protein